MLLQNSPSLENAIVELLASSSEGLTAEQIKYKVAAILRPYSRRGIYKELHRLLSEGVLVRSKAVYSLRLAWLLSLRSEIDRITQKIHDTDYLRTALPAKGSPILLRASDLTNWDRLWTQLMLVMHASLPNLPMFIWCPRHWFTLTHPEIEKTFTEANATKRNLRYAIIGGRGFLDLRDRDVLKRKSTCYSFRVSPFEDDRTHYYWLIGDYLGTSTLDAKTAREIDRVYSHVKKEKDIVPALRTRLLSQKCRGSVKCELAPEKASRMRSKFLRHFGVSVSESGELVRQVTGEV